jgi:hypothetical protein
MEPVRIFDDRYRYRSKPVRPDRTGRSTGNDRSTGDRPVYRQTDRSEIQTGTGSISVCGENGSFFRRSSLRENITNL